MPTPGPRGSRTISASWRLLLQGLNWRSTSVGSKFCSRADQLRPSTTSGTCERCNALCSAGATGEPSGMEAGCDTEAADA